MCALPFQSFYSLRVFTTFQALGASSAVSAAAAAGKVDAASAEREDQYKVNNTDLTHA